MRSLNKVQLIGNLGANIEVKETANGKKVATFSLATGEAWKDANGELQTTTDWHRCVAWEGLASLLEKYTTKGAKIYIEGKSKTRSYEKDGATLFITEILVKEVLLLSKSQEQVENLPQPDESNPTGDKDDLPF